MIECRVVHDAVGDPVKVDVVVDGKLLHRKGFDSMSSAESALQHAGFARSINDTWKPVLSFPSYTASRRTSTGVCDRTIVQRIDRTGARLELLVVEDAEGFAFMFHLSGTAMKMRYNCVPDPVMSILVGGLININAVGSWTTVEEAKAAGLAFLDRLLEVIPEPILVVLLDIERERRHAGREEEGTDSA